MQVLSLQDRRNYDPGIAGLGAGNVQRYCAFDLRGFLIAVRRSRIEAIEVVMCRGYSNVKLQALGRYSNASPD
jgi:hypothetical protein